MDPHILAFQHVEGRLSNVEDTIAQVMRALRIRDEWQVGCGSKYINHALYNLPFKIEVLSYRNVDGDWTALCAAVDFDLAPRLCLTTAIPRSAAAGLVSPDAAAAFRNEPPYAYDSESPKCSDFHIETCVSDDSLYAEVCQRYLKADLSAEFVDLHYSKIMEENTVIITAQQKLPLVRFVEETHRLVGKLNRRITKALLAKERAARLWGEKPNPWKEMAIRKWDWFSHCPE
ncbi:uncharacterized protein EV422DRAFT_580504, partial [Fimicolochytrium jonesii]|uniref:uncharacterized protein n=1 Tax=Fimicolochytrium jonesii TaxID=1396493 RepID=UPI0022FDE5FC